MPNCRHLLTITVNNGSKLAGNGLLFFYFIGDCILALHDCASGGLLRLRTIMFDQPDHVNVDNLGFNRLPRDITLQKSFLSRNLAENTICMLVTGPIATTKYGKLRGKCSTTDDGKPYFSFLGIPYARPPLGRLRFKSPEPPECWPGVRDAGREGNMCTQPFVQYPLGPNSLSPGDLKAFLKTVPTLVKRVARTFRQSEDCLYANVFTPQMPSEGHGLRPVVFWIHGGAFLIGDGDSDVFDPSNFVSAGIILVTFNYRLGPFGFFSTGCSAAPGNWGLKDQCAALRWVRDNIAAFGGDPHQVTLYGESAGAVSAHLHMLSPLSRGLFQRVVASSGTALHEWAYNSWPWQRALQFAAKLGLSDTADPHLMVEAMRRKSARQMLRAASQLLNVSERFAGHVMFFLPVVEVPGPDAFLSEPPAEVLRRGGQAQVPLILGMNSREGLLYYLGGDENKTKPSLHPERFVAKLNKRPQTLLPDDLYAALGEERRARCHQEVMQHYFGDRAIAADSFQQFIDVFSDITFLNRLNEASRLHAVTCSSAPTFIYYFTLDARLGFFKRLMKIEEQKGVAHADELGYIFPCKILPALNLPRDSAEMTCQRAILRLWVNFFKTGDPNSLNQTGDDVTRWIPISGDSPSYLEIRDTVYVREGYLGENCEFWDSLYKRYWPTREESSTDEIHLSQN